MLEASNYYTTFRWAGKDGYRCNVCPFDSFSKPKIREHVLDHLNRDGAQRAAQRAIEKAAKRRRTGPRTLEDSSPDAELEAAPAEEPVAREDEKDSSA